MFYQVEKKPSIFKTIATVGFQLKLMVN